MHAEYKILPIDISGGEKSIRRAERHLNAMSSEGWEVFAVVPGGGGDHSRFLAVAKRIGRERRGRRRADRPA